MGRHTNNQRFEYRGIRYDVKSFSRQKLVAALQEVEGAYCRDECNMVLPPDVAQEVLYEVGRLVRRLLTELKYVK